MSAKFVRRSRVNELLRYVLSRRSAEKLLSEVVRCIGSAVSARRNVIKDTSELIAHLL